MFLKAEFKQTLKLFKGELAVKHMELGQVAWPFIAAAVIAFMAIGSGNTGMYPVAGLLIVMGVGYPLISFGPIRKKIQEALEEKQS